MKGPAFERRWREALLEAMIPAPPGGTLPPMSAIDRRSFWERFARTAPLALRFAMTAAAVIVGGLLPPLLAPTGGWSARSTSLRSCWWSSQARSLESY